MLRIHPPLLKAFEDATLLEFEYELVEHSKRFSPRLSKVLGDEQLHVAIRQGMERADGYGFTLRGPIRLYIELMFLCGSHFDTDPQYLELGRILNSADDQMLRADGIYHGVVDYQKKVPGPKAANVLDALRSLALLVRSPVTFSSYNFEEQVLATMFEVFPKRAEYIGGEALTELIQEGRAKARGYAFSDPRHEALLIVLMFAFGHGCANDPLYPWISRTLQDEKIKDPAARARRLEKKATVWLEHVLARPRDGEQP